MFNFINLSDHILEQTYIKDSQHLHNISDPDKIDVGKLIIRTLYDQYQKLTNLYHFYETLHINSDKFMSGAECCFYCGTWHSLDTGMIIAHYKPVCSNCFNDSKICDILNQKYMNDY